jgi:threonine dehydrogenase-like Zn-dependent dehydrogenase
MLPLEGRAVIAGMHTEPVPINAYKAFQKSLTINFTSWYHRDHFALTLDALVSGTIDPTPMITHRVSFAELPRVYEELRAPGDHGKVLVTPRS